MARTRQALNCRKCRSRQAAASQCSCQVPLLVLCRYVKHSDQANNPLNNSFGGLQAAKDGALSSCIQVLRSRAMNSARAGHHTSCELGNVWLPSWGTILTCGRLAIAASSGDSHAALADAGRAAAVTAAAPQNIGSRPMSTSTAPGASAAAAAAACMAGTWPAHMACSWARASLQQCGQRMVKRMAPRNRLTRQTRMCIHASSCTGNAALHLPGCFNHKLQCIAC